MNKDALIKILVIGGGIWVLYTYLKSSGLLPAALGGSTFSDPAALLAYCKANPTGSATYQVTSASTPVTSTCAA